MHMVINSMSIYEHLQCVKHCSRYSNQSNQIVCLHGAVFYSEIKKINEIISQCYCQEEISQAGVHEKCVGLDGGFHEVWLKVMLFYVGDQEKLPKVLNNEMRGGETTP